ncbi:hydroxylase [Streptomyces camponoticapitis]|uniref:Hydroxylase n=1 Tax=Streptomyces camponoticapitis TaxID=1616125 RepID=A0ABQ2EYH4_9ACTN|nr:NmrA family NAD(P)-binding protein [Streptomyces camponoticapitis]GGK27684.1 hydroxylase [Streptomyces camponoticapitis]
MSYVIHGATGAQGAPVVSVLAAAGKSVVALTRRADAAVAGARVRPLDYSSSSELADAYRGAEGLFVHLPAAAPGDREAYVRHIVAAVREARPARVVFSTSGSGIGAPASPPSIPVDSAAATLIAGLEASEVSYAVIAPRVFLENLLLPTVVEAVRGQGVLRYPLRADFPVSWASHQDIADVAAVLLERPDVTGTVGVGQFPAVTGPDLAEAFAARLGRDVRYEAITPAAMKESITPLLGEGAAAGVAAFYQALGALPDHAIRPEHSAQELLGVTPQSTARWLADIGF